MTTRGDFKETVHWKVRCQARYHQSNANIQIRGRGAFKIVFFIPRIRFLLPPGGNEKQDSVICDCPGEGGHWQIKKPVYQCPAGQQKGKAFWNITPDLDLHQAHQAQQKICLLYLMKDQVRSENSLLWIRTLGKYPKGSLFCHWGGILEWDWFDYSLLCLMHIELALCQNSRLKTGDITTLNLWQFHGLSGFDFLLLVP
jgi:hypothetical protein